MDNIQLKFQNNGNNIELELPPKASLLKVALKVATNYQDNISKDSVLDEFLERRTEQMPKVFSKIKGFKKIFDKLKKQFGGYYGETWTVKNVTKIDDDSQTQSIDRRNLELECKGVLEDVHRNNVKAIVIYVKGCLSNEDNAYIVDRIFRDFNCTIIKYFTIENLKVTEIEVGFFGSNVPKRPEWMLFG